jgi:hypothetical protein
MATPSTLIFKTEKYIENGGILLNIVKRSPDYTAADASHSCENLRSHKTFHKPHANAAVIVSRYFYLLKS